MCPLVWRTVTQHLVIVADPLQVWDRRIVRYGEAEVAFAFAHRSCPSRTQLNWSDPARRASAGALCPPCPSFNLAVPTRLLVSHPARRFGRVDRLVKQFAGKHAAENCSARRHSTPFSRRHLVGPIMFS